MRTHRSMPVPGHGSDRSVISLWGSPILAWVVLGVLSSGFSHASPSNGQKVARSAFPRRLCVGWYGLASSAVGGGGAPAAGPRRPLAGSSVGRLLRATPAAAAALYRVLYRGPRRPPFSPWLMGERGNRFSRGFKQVFGQAFP